MPEINPDEEHVITEESTDNPIIRDVLEHLKDLTCPECEWVGHFLLTHSRADGWGFRCTACDTLWLLNDLASLINRQEE